jgi:sugar phosphate permease
VSSTSADPEGSASPGVDSARPFLGWRNVGAAFTAQFLVNGVTFAAFGVFVVPLSEDFDTPRGQLGLGLSFAFLVMGLMGPFVGRWLDRGHTRALMLIGTAIVGVGMMLLSRATDLWQMGLLFCGVVAVGGALSGMGPAQALVANWFVRRRGLALGIAVAGATMAGFIAPPLAAFLIDEVGWRGALAWFGGGALAIGLPVFALFVTARPEDVGQVPDGDAPETGAPSHETGSPGPAPVAPGTGELIRDPRLWLLAVGFGLVFTSPIVMTLVLVPYAEDQGISRQNAAYFFSAMAPFSLLGKIVFGALADRIPARRAIWIVVVGNFLVWALLYTDPSYRLLLAIGALYGLGIGAAGPLNGVVLGLCFGRLAFGRAQGIGGLASLPLIAGAPALSGFLYDTTGGYHAVFVAQMVMLLLGGVLLSLVRIPRTGS